MLSKVNWSDELDTVQSLINSGYSNKEIAEFYDVSPQVVAIKSKFYGLNTNGEIKSGIIRPYVHWYDQVFQHYEDTGGRAVWAVYQGEQVHGTIAGSDGLLWRFNKGKPYSFAGGDNYGYRRISRIHPETRVLRIMMVHIIIKESLHGRDPDPDKNQIDHINGIRHDNSVENLEWVTSKENMTRASTNGLLTRKRKRRRTPMGDMEALKIIEKFDPEIRGRGSITLGREHGVHPATIRNLVAGKTRKHVKYLSILKKMPGM